MKTKWRSSVIVAVLEPMRRHVDVIKRNERNADRGIFMFARFQPILDLVIVVFRPEIGQQVGCSGAMISYMKNKEKRT